MFLVLEGTCTRLLKKISRSTGRWKHVKRLQRTLFIRTKHTMAIFGVSPFFKVKKMRCRIFICFWLNCFCYVVLVSNVWKVMCLDFFLLLRLAGILLFQFYFSLADETQAKALEVSVVASYHALLTLYRI